MEPTQTGTPYNPAVEARYRFMVYQKQDILTYFDAGQMRTISQVLRTLEEDSFALLYPFSFADLHLQAFPEIASVYNTLNFPTQCRILDLASEYGKEGSSSALVAIDWESSSSLVIALGKQEHELRNRALCYAADPLIRTLIDDAFESDLGALLDHIQILLSQETPVHERYGCYSTPCSEEFFLRHLFTVMIDVEFSLTWGPNKDAWGRLTPSYISE